MTYAAARQRLKPPPSSPPAAERCQPSFTAQAPSARRGTYLPNSDISYRSPAWRRGLCFSVAARSIFQPPIATGGRLPIHLSRRAGIGGCHPPESGGTILSPLRRQGSIETKVHLRFEILDSCLRRNDIKNHYAFLLSFVVPPGPLR